MGIKTGFNQMVTRFKYFCATQSASFYAGMVFTVLTILALTVHIPLWISAILSPFATVAFYLAGRLMRETPKELKESGEIKDGILAAILGCIWVLLFVLI
jgi:hypothetical protein